MSEILAPCGNTECVSAAINSGADAVYLGEEYFSARKNAENFTYEKLCDAARLCHISGVKVYVALNTLVFGAEIPLLLKAVENCAKAGVDALIVQDMGVMRIAKQVVPDMPLHASTQMTVNSAAGVRAAEKLGFSRVILGRELSFEQIKDIVSGTDISIEVFVHGALCVSVSGQCYMSAMFGGRSANRGLCAGPCRLDFSCGERHNVLSLKDISVIEKLKELQGIGVASFKIEGRMKRPEYVAGAVNACRAALSGEAPDMDILGRVFSRSGFTDGYFNGSMKDMQGIRTRDDVLSVPSAAEKLRELYRKPFKRYTADMCFSLKKDMPASLLISANGVSADVKGALPQKAINREMTSEQAAAQLSKLGGTVYSAGKITADIDAGLTLSVSELNALRRKAIDALDNAIFEKNHNHYAIFPHETLSAKNKQSHKHEYRCEVSNKNQLLQALENKMFSRIYAPFGLLDEDIEDKSRIIAVLPAFTGDCEHSVTHALKTLKKTGYKYAAADTLSHIELIKNADMSACGTMRLNITNSYAMEEYYKLGLTDCVLSAELLIKDAAAICADSALKCGIISYGRLPLMLTRRCPIKDGKPCGKNKKTDCPKKITDRQGKEFLCLCNDNSVEILNPDILYLGDKRIDDMFDFVVFRFTDENDISAVSDGYLAGALPQNGFTRGLYYRKVK